MRFDSPNLLALIPAAALVLVLFYWWVRARRRRLLARFGEQRVVAKLVRGVSPGRQHLKYLLLVCAVLLILFSLARPQYGVVERPLQRRGVEVLIAIDCSESMLGQDIKPDRLSRAREQLRRLIHRLEGDNVGIIAFAGIPVVQCPREGRTSRRFGVTRWCPGSPTTGRHRGGGGGGGGRGCGAG